MTDDPSTTNDLGRRTLLGLAAGTATSLAGCTGNGLLAGGNDPALDVPDAARIDESISVVATGLPTDTPVRVEASARHPEGVKPWTATVTVRTDADGRIDLQDTAPEQGAYEGTDGMGLFWAMARRDVSRADAFFPLATHDVTLTVRPASDSTTDAADETTSDPVTEPSAPADALATATTTRRLPERETEQLGDGLVGTVHYPEESGPAPAVVLLHGSGANVMDEEARLLAAHGYVAASIQYFGNPDPLPDSLTEVPVEYVEQVIARLRESDRVHDGPVGTYGVSKGGELALLAAAHLDDVGAAVSVSGSGVVWEGVTQDNATPGTSSWTIDGEPVPYVPYPTYYPGSVRALYEAGLDDADAETIADATIPVERIDGPVVLCSGRDDGLWNARRLQRIAAERRKSNDAPVTHAVYDDAGHLLSPPFKPTYGLSDGNYEFGGTPAGNARAARSYWPVALETFEAGLRR